MGSVSLLKDATPVPSDDGARQFLTFELAGEEFALGILGIREILEYEQLTEVPLMPDFVRGVMNLRGAVVPVIDLALRFGRGRTELNRRTCIVIVELVLEEGSQLLGILVDAVHSVLTIPPDDVEPPPAFGARLRVDFIEGMARLDGGFIILLRMSRVLSLDEMMLLATARSEADSVAHDSIAQ
ncbi:chemotaxis protein CheW [Chitinibacteraceae bacterium HSL-7]